MDPTDTGGRFPAERRIRRAATTINSLGHDVLCMIFPHLNFFDLVRCSAVCKFWNQVVNKSKLLQLCYCKQQLSSGAPQKSLKQYLEDLAMEQHRLALEQGRIYIHQWRVHSARVNQCRMKMGLVLTGVGDKVMRLWSIENYKCLETYSIPEMEGPLVDFDFDESKVVGLIGSRICIWRPNGTRSIFPSHAGTFPKGLCMRYSDPEAVVGCEDGVARVLDMYSRKCSKIIRMHSGPVTCLCLSEDQLILSGSSVGSVRISGLLSDQRVATLRSPNSAGVTALCFDPSSHMVFAGSTSGSIHCWDLRTMKSLWETRASPNVIYSLQHLSTDKSSLIVGGIDGVVRVLNQNTGELCSSCIIDNNYILSKYENTSNGFVEVEQRRGIRMRNDSNLDAIPRTNRPPITCLAVGMKKVVTMHNDRFIRVWKFNKFD